MPLQVFNYRYAIIEVRLLERWNKSERRRDQRFRAGGWGGDMVVEAGDLNESDYADTWKRRDICRYDEDISTWRTKHCIDSNKTVMKCHFSLISRQLLIQIKTCHLPHNHIISPALCICSKTFTCFSILKFLFAAHYCQNMTHEKNRHWKLSSTYLLLALRKIRIFNLFKALGITFIFTFNLSTH